LAVMAESPPSLSRIGGIGGGAISANTHDLLLVATPAWWAIPTLICYACYPCWLPLPMVVMVVLVVIAPPFPLIGGIGGAEDLTLVLQVPSS
jgi:hypothetical protein